jgi:predicted HTH domain antitoxin
MELKMLREIPVEYPDGGKFFLVVGLLLSEKISLGKAANLLELRVDELIEIMEKSGIRYNIYDDEEIERELKNYDKVFSD